MEEPEDNPYYDSDDEGTPPVEIKVQKPKVALRFVDGTVRELEEGTYFIDEDGETGRVARRVNGDLGVEYSGGVGVFCASDLPGRIEKALVEIEPEEVDVHLPNGQSTIVGVGTVPSILYIRTLVGGWRAVYTISGHVVDASVEEIRSALNAGRAKVIHSA